MTRSEEEAKQYAVPQSSEGPPATGAANDNARAEQSPEPQLRHERGAVAAALSQVRASRAVAEQAASRVLDDQARAALAAIVNQLAGMEGSLSEALDGLWKPSELHQVAAAAAEAVRTAYQVANESGAESAEKEHEVAHKFVARHEIEAMGKHLFTDRIFDQWLQFDSAQEQEEHERRRKMREAEAQYYTQSGKPEDALRAIGTMQGQMLDDAAHGATNSPEFERKWNELLEMQQRQVQAMKDMGRSTKDIDDQIRATLRKELQRINKLSAEQIEQVMGSDDPMAAAKAYLSQDRESIARLEQATRQAGQNINSQDLDLNSATQPAASPMESVTTAPAAEPEAKPMSAWARAASQLKVAGVTTETAPAPVTGHGLVEPERGPGGRTIG